jgi:hypothetical protein
VLASTPLTIGTNTTLVVLFSTSLNLITLENKNTAHWVDLVELHPILKVEAVVAFVVHEAQNPRENHQNPPIRSHGRAKGNTLEVVVGEATHKTNKPTQNRKKLPNSFPWKS